MINALAGGDALEIIVALKDLTAGGFRTVEGNLTSLERKANGTNFSGFSKATKAMEADAESAAGKEAKGGGGIGGLAAGMLGLGGGPATIAIAAIGATAAAGLALEDTYSKVHQQELALTQAATDHHISQNGLNDAVDRAINLGQQYAFSADDVRAAVLELTNAGMSLADQQTSMGPIMDLARAKNLSLADASKMYELAVMGNTRAVKDLGILLPPVSASAADLGKAQAKVTTAEQALTAAQEHLTATEEKLRQKHKDHSQDAVKLHDAEVKVQNATDKLKIAQEGLTLAQQGGIDKASRMKIVSDAITKAVGDQRTAVTPLQQAQVQLGNTWEHIAEVTGPGIEDLFTRLLVGINRFIGGIEDMIANFTGAFNKIATIIAHSPLPGFLNAIGGAAGTIGNIAGGIGGLIPHFAAGGVVDRPTLALIGEGGEREYVIPESRMGGGGGTVQININSAFPPTPSMAADLADALERELGRRVLRPSGTGAF